MQLYNIYEQIFLKHDKTSVKDKGFFYRIQELDFTKRARKSEIMW